jgi:hypothetical protein
MKIKKVFNSNNDYSYLSSTYLALGCETFIGRVSSEEIKLICACYALPSSDITSLNTILKKSCVCYKYRQIVKLWHLI